MSKNKLYLKLPKKYNEFDIVSIKDTNYSAVTVEDFKDIDINDIMDMPIFYSIGDTDIHNVYDIKKVHTECSHDQTAHIKNYNEFTLSLITFKKSDDIFPASREYCSFTVILTKSEDLKIMLSHRNNHQSIIDVSTLTSSEVKEIVFKLLTTIQHYDSFEVTIDKLNMDRVMTRIIELKSMYAYNKANYFVCDILSRRGAAVYKNFTKLKFTNDEKFYAYACEFYKNAEHLRKNYATGISVKIDMFNKAITIYHECDYVESSHFVIYVNSAEFVEITTNNSQTNTYVDNTVDVGKCIITVKRMGTNNDNFMQVLYKFIDSWQYAVGEDCSVNSVRIDTSQGMLEITTDVDSNVHLFEVPLLVYDDIIITRRLNEKDLRTK